MANVPSWLWFIIALLIILVFAVYFHQHVSIH